MVLRIAKVTFSGWFYVALKKKNLRTETQEKNEKTCHLSQYWIFTAMELPTW